MNMIVWNLKVIILITCSLLYVYYCVLAWKWDIMQYIPMMPNDIKMYLCVYSADSAIALRWLLLVCQSGSDFDKREREEG